MKNLKVDTLPTPTDITSLPTKPTLPSVEEHEKELKELHTLLKTLMSVMSEGIGNFEKRIASLEERVENLSRIPVHTESVKVEKDPFKLSFASKAHFEDWLKDPHRPKYIGIYAISIAEVDGFSLIVTNEVALFSCPEEFSQYAPIEAMELCPNEHREKVDKALRYRTIAFLRENSSWVNVA